MSKPLSQRRCWQITQRTLRVDPRCAQKDMLKHYAAQLHNHFQILKADFQDNPREFLVSRHKHSLVLAAVMTPFITASYLNGYRDTSDVLGLKLDPSTMAVLRNEAAARAQYSADVMVATTIKRIEQLERLAEAEIQDEIDEVDDVDDSDIDQLENTDFDDNVIDDPDLDDQNEVDPFGDAITQDKDILEDIAEDIGDAWMFSEDRAEAAIDYEGTKGYQKSVETVLAAQPDKWMKIWVVSPDHPETDECDSNEADGPIPINATFSSGADNVPEHPNCKCSVYYEKVRP